MKKIAASLLYWIGHGFSKVLELNVPQRWEDRWGRVWYPPYNRCMQLSYRLDPSEWKASELDPE